MYGTVARCRAKPGHLDEIESLTREMNRELSNIDGGIAGYLFKLNKDENELIPVALFRDKQSYMANADDPEQDEEEIAPASVLPPGFVAAVYRADENRSISLWLDRTELPGEWSVGTAGHDAHRLLTAEEWRLSGCSERMELPWQPVLPPEKLVVRWDDSEAFLPVNAEDQRALPPPAGMRALRLEPVRNAVRSLEPHPTREWTRAVCTTGTPIVSLRARPWRQIVAHTGM